MFNKSYVPISGLFLLCLAVHKPHHHTQFTCRGSTYVVTACPRRGFKTFKKTPWFFIAGWGVQG